MKRAILALVAILLIPPLAHAGTWTFDGTYWWYDGVAYVENWKKEVYQEPYQYYDYAACCYKTAYTTKYKWKAYYSRVNIYKPEASFDNNLQALTKIASDRNKSELRIREKAAEVQLLAQAADIYGLRGNFRLDSFGLNPYLSVYTQQQYGSTYGAAAYPAGQQGATLYQYRQSTDAFGLKLLDLDVADQTSARLVQGGLDYTNQANAGRLAFVKEAGAQAARIAEIRERGAAAERVFRATEPQVSVQSRSTTTVVVPKLDTAPLTPQVTDPRALEQAHMPRAKVDPAAFYALSGPQKCVSCHGDKGKDQSRFDLTRYHPLTATREQKALVLSYISDPKGCPKDGVTLTTEEKLQFLTGDGP